MTMSAMQVYGEYAKKVGNLSFDGKPLKPFHEMGVVQKAGWQAVAYLCNRHATEAVEAERRRAERRIAELERDNDLDAYG